MWTAYTLGLLLVANIFIPFAFLQFAAGFFPYKPFLAGQAQYPDDGHPPPPAPFNKVIFMVVDALRRFAMTSDFMTKLNIAVTLCIQLIQALPSLRGMRHLKCSTW